MNSALNLKVGETVDVGLMRGLLVVARDDTASPVSYCVKTRAGRYFVLRNQQMIPLRNVIDFNSSRR